MEEANLQRYQLSTEMARYEQHSLSRGSAQSECPMHFQVTSFAHHFATCGRICPGKLSSKIATVFQRC